jgi:hypothetical protein
MSPRQTLSQRFFGIFRGTRNTVGRNRGPHKNSSFNTSIRVPRSSSPMTSRPRSSSPMTSRPRSSSPMTSRPRSSSKNSNVISSKIQDLIVDIEHARSMKYIFKERLKKLKKETSPNEVMINKFTKMLEGQSSRIKKLNEEKEKLTTKFKRNP